MEKIWIKKDLYFKSYWFLNIRDLFQIFIWFLLIFPYWKGKNGGFILHRTHAADVAHTADMACGTLADATWHARPHGRAARAHAAPRWRRDGADAWQGHASPRGHSVIIIITMISPTPPSDFHHRVEMSPRVTPRSHDHTIKCWASDVTEVAIYTRVDWWWSVGP